ncbi:hypothetical protein [Streptomyces sp. MMG1121]|uniref:hypothetical protein n=1 Tax=Streptomyces sp. MMG1121 TaxID=1415544 RepID=UPI000AAB8D18|nr:hypothetical protein [Streptomyces sp. MMG1121]
MAAVGLRAPAVCAPEAWEVPFGDGGGRFSGIIRTPDSRRDSAALEALRAYEGRAVPAVPGTDAAIPPAVTEAVQDALSARARFPRFEVPGAEHRLGLRFRDHIEDRQAFAARVLADVAGAGEGHLGVRGAGCPAAARGTRRPAGLSGCHA